MKWLRFRRFRLGKFSVRHVSLSRLSFSSFTFTSSGEKKNSFSGYEMIVSLRKISSLLA